jgi:hypothetical protein
MLSPAHRQIRALTAVGLRGEMQNTQFGVARGDRLSKQVAKRNGG